MAKEETVDEKKPGEDGQPPVAETILASEQRDPNEAAVAEQALRHFIRDRLEAWHQQVDTALDTLEAWIMQQPQDQQSIFSERAYFDSLGDHFMGQLFNIAGGKGTPIMDAIAAETDQTVAFAEHSVFNVSIFINEMRRGVRDACWYMRDACQAVLSNQWADLLDLATGGSMEFVSALFKMGLPSESFKPEHMSDKLTSHSEAYRRSVAPKQEIAEEKANEKGVDEEKATQAEEDAKDMQEEQEMLDVKKEAQEAVV